MHISVQYKYEKIYNFHDFAPFLFLLINNLFHLFIIHKLYNLYMLLSIYLLNNYLDNIGTNIC